MSEASLKKLLFAWKRKEKCAFLFFSLTYLVTLQQFLLTGFADIPSITRDT